MKRLTICCLILSSFTICRAQQKIFVAPYGNDKNNGTFFRPLKTLPEALRKAITFKSKHVQVELRKGSYLIANTVNIGADEFLPHSLTITAYGNEPVTVTGADTIHPHWQNYHGGIMVADILFRNAPDQLFLNGQSLHMARYPNYDSSARVFNGTAADAVSDERVKT